MDRTPSEAIVQEITSTKSDIYGLFYTQFPTVKDSRQAPVFLTSPIPYMHDYIYSSPIGCLAVTIVGGSVTQCRWMENAFSMPQIPPPPVSATWHRLKAELDAYFSGTGQNFSVPLHYAGTPFQHAVWDALLTVGYGQRVSYTALAHAVGKPKAVRAVAQACHRNPLALLLPCHRVVGADGSMTGYAAGIWRKEWLLKMERDGTTMT